jgi:DNA-binding HxlR family transcriptional regulator
MRSRPGCWTNRVKPLTRRARLGPSTMPTMMRTCIHTSLRTLERDGLVTRTVTPSVPMRVDYELTALGRTLLPVMVGIKDWAEAHVDEVNTARRVCDEARTTAVGAG